MSAIISADGLYRQRLDRYVADAGPSVALTGVNPSTAGPTVNDATIRKDLGFARRLGWSRIIKANVFDYRATDVTELSRVAAPVSSANLEHLMQIFSEADILVACWGRRDKVPRALHPYIDFTLALMRGFGKPVMCFGLTAGGDPRHTLMLGYDTPLVAL